MEFSFLWEQHNYDTQSINLIAIQLGLDSESLPAAFVLFYMGLTFHEIIVQSQIVLDPLLQFRQHAEFLFLLPCFFMPFTA